MAELGLKTRAYQHKMAGNTTQIFFEVIRKYFRVVRTNVFVILLVTLW
jgi:hypothetical protein